MTGTRGPKSVPDNVLKLRGSRHLQQRQRERGDSVEPEIEIPGCPKHLLPEARKEWRRLTPELQVNGLVSKLDRAALALACQEWAWWVWHDTCFQRDVEQARKKREAWEKEHPTEPWTGGDGLQVPTPNGSWTYNPHWVARQKAGTSLDRFLASFGLSPSSRGRVTPSSRQPYLPGMEPKEGFAAL